VKKHDTLVTEMSVQRDPEIRFDCWMFVLASITSLIHFVFGHPHSKGVISYRFVKISSHMRLEGKQGFGYKVTKSKVKLSP
jgi:hypothetical protein